MTNMYYLGLSGRLPSINHRTPSLRWGRPGSCTPTQPQPAGACTMQTLDLPTAPATPHQQKPRNSTTKDISRPGTISGPLSDLGLKNIRPPVGPRSDLPEKNIRPIVGPAYLHGCVVPVWAPWVPLDRFFLTVSFFYGFRSP